MFRVVLGEHGEILVDLAGRAFGRGGWVHPRPDCVGQMLHGGAARSFKAEVTTSAAVFHAALCDAVDARVSALLVSARGASRLAAGTNAVEAAFTSGQATLILVAEDARAAAVSGFLARAGAMGKVLVWGTKAGMGKALGRPDTAVVALTDPGFAGVVSRAVALRSLPEPGARRPGLEKAFVEVR